MSLRPTPLYSCDPSPLVELSRIELNYVLKRARARNKHQASRLDFHLAILVLRSETQNRQGKRKIGNCANVRTILQFESGDTLRLQ